MRAPAPGRASRPSPSGRPRPAAGSGGGAGAGLTSLPSAGRAPAARDSNAAGGVSRRRGAMAVSGVLSQRTHVRRKAPRAFLRRLFRRQKPRLRLETGGDLLVSRWPRGGGWGVNAGGRPAPRPPPSPPSPPPSPHPHLPRTPPPTPSPPYLTPLTPTLLRRRAGRFRPLVPPTGGCQGRVRGEPALGPCSRPPRGRFPPGVAGRRREGREGYGVRS